MRQRHALVLVHRYAAFLLGAWFALLGLTGAALVFRDELDRWLNPGLLAGPGPAAGSGIAVVHRAALTGFPGAHVERILVPRDATGSYRVLLRTDGRRRVGSPRLEAMFAGDDGRLLGSRDPDARSLRPEHLLQTIHDLHHRILLGNDGKDAVGLVGVALVLTGLIGIVLGVPRIDGRSLLRAVAVKFRAGTKRVVYDLHRAAGMTAGCLLLLAGGTGAMMAYPEYSRDVIGLVSPVRPMPAVPWRGADAAPSDIAPDVPRLVDAMRMAYPAHEVRELHLPVRPTAPVLVYLDAPGDLHRLGDTLVLLHAVTGERLLERSRKTRTGGETVLHWLVPLHGGTAFGTPGRWVACLAGLLPLWLLCSGLLIWWYKTRPRRENSRVHVARG